MVKLLGVELGRAALTEIRVGRARDRLALLRALNDHVALKLRERQQHVAQQRVDRVVGQDAVLNSTPVGMYPKENAAPLHYLPHKTEYVFDAIYNPPVTWTMKLANPRKTKTRDGLFMLVMQAAHAQTIWTGVTFEPQACETILRRTYGKMAVKRLHEKHGKKNLVLCGFMGSGKTTIGRKLARLTGLEFIDADIYLEAKEGKKISEIFAEKGEAYFRNRETAYIKELAQKDGIVLALGGGSVLRPENVAAVDRKSVV